MTSTEPHGFPPLTIHADYNHYLAEGAGTVDAVLTIVTNSVDAGTELTLRLWTPASARVAFVKQVAPSVEDLTELRVDAENQCGDYSLGTWGDGARDYYLEVVVEPAAVGREKLAARTTLICSGQAVGEAMVKVVWTADAAQSARISKRVADCTGRAELKTAIDDGLIAREKGDIATATAKLKRAVDLAMESGDGGTARLLRTFVDGDEHPGTARLRRNVDPADEMEA